MMHPTIDYLSGFEANASRGGWSPDAFACQRCPKDGCPAWWKLAWERPDANGVVRERDVEGCGIAMAPALLIRVLVAQAQTQDTMVQRTGEMVQVQEDVKRGVGAALKGILVVAAKNSGNPAAAAIAPMLPRILGSVRRLLPRRKGKN